LALTIPQNKNPFLDMMPEELEPYLEEQVTRIQNSPMWQQSVENPSLLTPTQQLEWFELLTREETVRLLQDSSRTMWGDNRCVKIQLPLRAVPEQTWNKLLARLPQRLANYANYPRDERREFGPNEGPDGLDAVETIIRKFLKEADAELFPLPGKSASVNRKPALSDKDQEIYKHIGHENIATSTNQELWKAYRSQLGFSRDGLPAFRSRLHRIRGFANLPSSKNISRKQKKSVQP